MDDGIDYIAERGLGAWLRQRREKKGLSATEVAQASSLASRTVLRYEEDKGLGYETIRLLDALGVTLKPGPPRGGPVSVNGELRLLRRELAARAAADAERYETLDRRLRSLEESAALARRALELLEAQVARPADGDDGSPPAAKTGTDG